MVKQGRKLWKEEYSIRLQEYLEKYDKCFLVGIDNVRSSQMHKIRHNLRGKAELLMGKNTLIRRVINQLTEKNPDLAKIMNHIRENVGFVFTNDDLKTVKDEICKNTVEAPAKAGAIAQRSVVLPKQQTTLGPEKTSFFQALAIPTKITRGTIEILNDVNLIQEGDKVGASEATLLGMLKIYPFTYGLLIKQVYDSGSIFEPAILDITTEDLLSRFMEGVRNIAAASLAIDHPTMASVPHSIANGFKKLLCVSVATDYTFKESEKLKEMLADPSKFMVAAPVAAAATAAAPAETKEEEPESDSDASMGMGLFD